MSEDKKIRVKVLLPKRKWDWATEEIKQQFARLLTGHPWFVLGSEGE